MKRSRHRLLVVLVAALGVSLVSTTSYAFYRATIGARQCCKKRCRHHHDNRQAAERCCKTPPQVPPATIGSTRTAEDAAAPAHAIFLSTQPQVLLAPAMVRALASITDGRAPPGTSLFAHHTSLLI